MTALIQLSAETRGLLAEAFPQSTGQPALRRSELSRTARAARELLWRSHRDELGYCAAARAYLMEWEDSFFDGLHYSAISHGEYQSRAQSYISRHPAGQLRHTGGELSSQQLCRIAYQLVPSGSNRLRLAVAEKDLALFGALDDWRAAYSMTSDPVAHTAAAAQSAGLLLIWSRDLVGAAQAYSLAWSLAGYVGDLVLAASLGGASFSRFISTASLHQAVAEAMESPGLLESIRAVLGRLGSEVGRELIDRAETDVRRLLESIEVSR
jgi:hypothetical protein